MNDLLIAVSVKEDDMQNVANWIEEKDESTTSEFDKFLGKSLLTRNTLLFFSRTGTCAQCCGSDSGFGSVKILNFLQDPGPDP
jgi:hypothetical protein